MFVERNIFSPSEARVVAVPQYRHVRVDFETTIETIVYQETNGGYRFSTTGASCENGYHFTSLMSAIRKDERLLTRYKMRANIARALSPYHRDYPLYETPDEEGELKDNDEYSHSQKRAHERRHVQHERDSKTEERDDRLSRVWEHRHVWKPAHDERPEREE